MADAGGEPAVHLWLDDPGAADGLDGWDPDAEPARFASGVGHNLLELAVRLRRRGVPVTVGQPVPPAATVVVSFRERARRMEARLLWQSASIARVHIASDADPAWQPLLPPELTVVPNRSPFWAAHVAGPVQWLPVLPQRGLLPRDPGRDAGGTTLSVIAFKGNPEHVPDFLRDPAWQARLGERGVRLWLDVPDRTDGSDQRWHDFREVDAVICLRNPSLTPDPVRKPATKLLNAWAAGSIPLIAAEPALLELARDGQDALVVTSGEEVLAALDALRADPDRARRLRQAGQERAREFATDAVLRQWEDALLGWRSPWRGRPAAAAWRGRVLAALAVSARRRPGASRTAGRRAAARGTARADATVSR